MSAHLIVCRWGIAVRGCFMSIYGYSVVKLRSVSWYDYCLCRGGLDRQLTRFSGATGGDAPPARKSNELSDFALEKRFELKTISLSRSETDDRTNRF
jgi:hypothetical protein